MSMILAFYVVALIVWAIQRAFAGRTLAGWLKAEGYADTRIEFDLNPIIRKADKKGFYFRVFNREGDQWVRYDAWVSRDAVYLFPHKAAAPTQSLIPSTHSPSAKEEIISEQAAEIERLCGMLHEQNVEKPA